MSVHILIYRSAPVFRGTVSSYLDQLDSIIATSRLRNVDVNVTGVMLFNEDWFVQHLEGPEIAVRATFERISRDPRHEQVEILFDGSDERRHFPEWSMAFVGHAEAVRQRFSASPLAGASVKLRGREVVDYIVALADFNRENQL